MVNTDLFIIMGLGILSTTLLHIAKAMERHGIEIFDQIRSKVTGQAIEGVEGGAKKPTIYIVGVILNNLTPIWAILANFFGPPSYLTSMFGLGLIALMIYAAKVLHEPIQRIEYFGAVVLVTGTLLLGIDGLLRPTLDMSTMDEVKSFIFVGIFIALGLVAIGIALKKNSTTVIGIIFGLFAGGCGGLDPVFKGIGQKGGLPANFLGWFIFLLSFGIGTIAFMVTQWGFARKANASTLVPSYNSLYVVVPILIQAWALPGFGLTWLTWVGMVITIIGIVLMQAFKQPKAGHH